MLVEHSDLINLFEAKITLCCPERKDRTLCLDCRGLWAAVGLIRLYIADPRMA